MAKTALLGGRTVKVENRSGFDKSRLNLLTTGVGTITPILKQLVIPSSGKISVAIHAELPPLATDAYLRSHLKLEAFFVPLRLCYGGFQSWFSGEPVRAPGSLGETDSASLPYAFIATQYSPRNSSVPVNANDSDINAILKPASLSDFFDIKIQFQDGTSGAAALDSSSVAQLSDGELFGEAFNIFPYLAYQLCYHHFYRNKSVQKPVFVPTPVDLNVPFRSLTSSLPFFSSYYSPAVALGAQEFSDGSTLDDIIGESSDGRSSALNGFLYDGYALSSLRQRNYGDDYFTAARPSAQAGNPITVQADADGRFTIASLRLQNSLQEFAEANNYASPDYVQVMMARYGAAPSDGVVQKPILLGSADFPMFTKPVELTANSAAEDIVAGSGNYRNPFSNEGILGATAGRASANGSEFVCDFSVNEPGYILVNATLVPEANYAFGISHDMKMFTKGRASLVDLPCGLLENVGDEPIYQYEAGTVANRTAIFGYVQRFLWHKIGNVNGVHGLFRKGQSLDAFAPQREVSSFENQISSAFLKIPKTALDGVAAVRSGISDFGVMMDCAIKMFVSEPLSESALPSLVDPAREHGKSVYLKNGGSPLA